MEGGRLVLSPSTAGATLLALARGRCSRLPGPARTQKDTEGRGEVPGKRWRPSWRIIIRLTPKSIYLQNPSIRTFYPYLNTSPIIFFSLLIHIVLWGGHCGFQRPLATASTPTPDVKEGGSNLPVSLISRTHSQGEGDAFSESLEWVLIAQC